MISARREAAAAARREKWAHILSEAEASGLAVRTYCQQHELNENLFYHWRHVLELDGRKRQSSAAGSGFVLVKTAEQSATLTESADLELILDAGRRLRIPRGFDAATLRSVLEILAAGARSVCRRRCECIFTRRLATCGAASMD
jgi:hypothetical protein